MMTAFQQAASAQSGTSEFVPLRLRPNDAIHLYLLFWITWGASASVKANASYNEEFWSK